MRHLTGLFLFSMLLSAATSSACGNGEGCVAGFGQNAAGQYYVKDFTPAVNTQHVSASSHNVESVSDIYNDAGFIVGWEAIIDGVNVTFVFPVPVPPSSLAMQFLPTKPPSSLPYNLYMHKDLLVSDRADTVTPFGRTAYRGTRCTGSCKKVIGNLDSVIEAPDGVVVAGWACDRLTNKSITVQVFAGGPAGTGTHIRSGTANLSLSDSAKIKSICGTSVGHRFRVKIPIATANAYRGKTIYVRGVSASGGSHLYLLQSGKLVISAPRVKGYIDGLTISNWNAAPLSRKVSIRGWACQQGINKSINVQIYAGGPRGVGQLITTSAKASTTPANLASETGVSSECGTTLKKHRFNIQMNAALVYTQAGKRLYVHGLSTNGTPHYALERSNYFTMPVHSSNDASEMELTQASTSASEQDAK